MAEENVENKTQTTEESSGTCTNETLNQSVNNSSQKKKEGMEPVEMCLLIFGAAMLIVHYVFGIG